jgi:hypothetical protein
MPFDSIVLKYRYEGLFIPGLGTRRCAECGRAMMDFLPRLIPGTLSMRVDVTLAAVRSESNNGYDYLWRVLELYVPGFDPIIPIHPRRIPLCTVVPPVLSTPGQDTIPLHRSYSEWHLPTCNHALRLR